MSVSLHSWKTIRGGRSASRGGNTTLSLDVPNPGTLCQMTGGLWGSLAYCLVT